MVYMTAQQEAAESMAGCKKLSSFFGKPKPKPAAAASASGAASSVGGGKENAEAAASAAASGKKEAATKGDAKETKDHAVEAAAAAGAKKGEYQGSPKLKAALQAVERKSAARLAELDAAAAAAATASSDAADAAAARAAAPSRDEIEALLLSLGGHWPTQNRPNVTEREDGVVPGMCLGLVHALGGQARRWTDNTPSQSVSVGRSVGRSVSRPTRMCAYHHNRVRRASFHGPVFLLNPSVHPSPSFRGWQGMKTSNLAECFPAMTRLIVRWVAATLPATEACTARDDVAHQDISSLTH